MLACLAMPIIKLFKIKALKYSPQVKFLLHCRFKYELFTIYSCGLLGIFAAGGAYVPTQEKKTNSGAGAMFRRSAWSPAKLPAPREALIIAGRGVRQKMPESKKCSLKSVAPSVDDQMN